MITRRFGWWILAAGVLLLAPAAAGAQELAPPRLTISAGYQFMSDPSWDTHLTLGWVGAVTQKLNDRTFIVAEGSGGYGEITGGFMMERYAMLGGFKVQPPGDGPRIFIQALAGLSRQAGDVGHKEWLHRAARRRRGVADQCQIQWPRLRGLQVSTRGRAELSRLTGSAAGWCLCSGGSAIPVRIHSEDDDEACGCSSGRCDYAYGGRGDWSVGVAGAAVADLDLGGSQRDVHEHRQLHREERRDGAGRQVHLAADA